MRKKLLLQLLVLVFTVGAYAANVGDYLYTVDAKYQVTGANIFVNGNFAQGLDATWVNEQGGAVSSDVWGIETGKGPNGENVIISKSGSVAKGTWLHFALNFTQAGTYSFSYWVKAEATALTSIVATPSTSADEDNGTSGTNAVKFFTNTTGDNTDENVISTQTSFGTEWKQVIFTLTANAGDYLVFNAAQIATGTMFTNFEVYPVNEVYDTRIADRLLKYWKALYAEPDLPLQKDDLLKPYIDALEALVASGEVDAASMTAIQLEAADAVEMFLEVNAGNLVGTTVDGISTSRYLSDWANWGYMNWNNMQTRGTWYFTGGRKWGFSPNCIEGVTKDGDNLLEAAYLERPWEDGYVATVGIQTSYTLDDAGVKIVDGTFNGKSMKPGKYMFSIEAQATAAANKAAPYGSNPGVEIAGPWMWVGADTTVFRPLETADAATHPTWKGKDETTVLNDNNWQRLYVIGEIKEGEDINCGFHFPVLTGSGGRYSLRNPEFRAIGVNQETVDHLYAYDQLAVQQTALKERLDLANADNAKTLADGYPWGHKNLTDSINKYTEAYNTLLTVVDAEGKELQPEKVTLAYKDEILAAVQAMNRARNNFANTNKVYQTLIADIAIANESYNAPANAAGDKATFKAVIDKAQGMVDATQYDVDQVDEFNAMDSELLNAKEAFELGTASRANPTDMLLQNGCFQDIAAQNITSSKTVGGWNFTLGTDMKEWGIAATEDFESGKSAGEWRGTTVGPNGRAQQTRKLTKAGLYEFRSKAYSCESGDQARWTEYCNIAKYAQILDEATFDMIPVDTLYLPNIRLFFGPNGATNDSITITKCAPVYGQKYYRTTPLSYSVFYLKQNDAEEEIEIGFEAFENAAAAGANSFGFGDNHLYYVGSEAAYKTALQADYEAEVTKAKALIAKYPDFSWVSNKFYKYFGETIPEAEYAPIPAYNKNVKAWVTKPAEMTIQEMQNAYLSIIELENLLEFVANYKGDETGIANDLVKDQPTAVRNGIYTITGVRVQGDVKSLPRGLYIINGKKVVIK